MVQLTPMSEDDLAVWFPAMLEEYLGDVLASGATPEAARQNVRENQERVAPGGVLAPDQHVLDVSDDGTAVGVIWIGEPRVEGSGEWYIYDVVVNKEFRGTGYGRQTMEAAEEWVRARGGTRLALNVFGFNVVARRLYDSLGYQVRATLMYKTL